MLSGKKPKKTSDDDWEELEMKVMSTIRICLANEILYQVMEEELSTAIWTKLESRYVSKSLTNKLFLKRKLYGLKMAEVQIWFNT